MPIKITDLPSLSAVVGTTILPVIDVGGVTPTSKKTTVSNLATQILTGNAATSTKLATARTINGVLFDGTQNISITAADLIPIAQSSVLGAVKIGAGINVDGAGVISVTNISGNAATVSNGVYTTGSYSDPTWLTISKNKVGLGNVTNESKATMFTSPALTNATFSGTVSGITAAMVGLGNVTNESKSTLFTSPVFTGIVTGVTATHVGLGNVTNESKATMFTNPTFTGTPVATTAIVGTNTTQIATTAFVSTAVSNLVDSAPSALNTLNELATALGNDANFATSVATAIGLKAPLDSPTFTGTVAGVTKSMVGLGNVTNESKATMFTSPTFTGTVAGVTATHVGLGNVTNESKATMFTSPTFTGTVAGVTKSMVGLGNVDNTADANKNVLYATTAGGAPATDVYTWAKAATKPSYTATDVGLGNVTNESKATMFTNPTFTGTVSGLTVSASSVGLGNVTNESKATMFTNPTFTGTVSGLTVSASSVGLGNVTNESKATMFSSPIFTGNASFSSYASIKSLLETATVTASSPASTQAFDVITQGMQYYTSASANAFTLNVRGNNSTTLASVLSAGKSVSIGLLVTCSNAAHYMTAVNIDGTATGVTTKWQGGDTPVAGNASSIDVYTLTIIKTAETPTYTVLGTLTKFA